ETIRHKAIPCFYATLTTIAAFISLLVSSIKPVMDFGLMMTVGLVVSFILTFLIFPAAAMLVKRENITAAADRSTPFTMLFATFTKRHGRLVILISLTLTVISVVGISRLVVENRFIDYFRKSTEIYQGMKLIDQKLGGTTPLDIILDFHDKSAPTPQKTVKPGTADNADDLLLDDFADVANTGSAKKAKGDGAWFTSYKMERLEKIQDYLNSLPETGKVQSIANLVRIATRLNDGIALDDYELAIIYKKLPKKVKDLLVTPYVSIPNNQARITMRIMESDKKLSREKLLNKIHNFLTQKMHFAPAQIHFTNMFVLYNNMLQSLFRSQILTIGAVFLCILLMFTLLFRSLLLAIIALLPNLLPAAMVLGTMGWIGLPLDLMTITIASITIGIAVDDTIHYIHRFRDEFSKDRNYTATMERCHGSIGKAMYYTSLTIVIGFSILVFSNFKPTIYFGLFTGFAMVAALLAALTLLPKLLILWQPFGPEADKTSVSAPGKRACETPGTP
ncbi:MAG: MMPL family transporter, partial [Deltaproteobacteria bacterium]|nr:MMPL family transporter [Deltaproteobacteria bacterium]